MKESLDQLRALLDSIEQVGATGVQVAQVGRALTDIASGISAVAQAQEKPPEWVGALVAAINGLKFPDVSVPAPVVNLPAPIVNVAAPEIALPAPPAPAPPTGWRMRISKRDDIGRIAEILLTPEN